MKTREGSEGEEGRNYLVVDVVEYVFPEYVEDGHRDEETTDGHPEAIRKGSESKRDDCGREKRRDEDDEGFGGEKIEVEK